jgi:hypothetical protein
MFAATVIGWMSFLSLRQLAVTACWCGSSVSFLWAVLVKASAPAPQTAVTLSVISPDVADRLAVVALDKSILASMSLHPDSNVAEAWLMDIFLVISCPRQGYEEQWQVYDFGRFGR